MLFALLFTLCHPPAIAAGTASAPLERVDWAVAMVGSAVLGSGSLGSAVVTESDIRLHIALSATDPSPVPVLSRTSQSVVDDAINAAIIRLLAGGIAIYQPNPAQLRIRLEAYRVQWPDVAAWTAHLQAMGIDERRLTNAISRRMVIERLVSRALGKPKDGETEQWRARFDEWIAHERASIRVRLVPPIDASP